MESVMGSGMERRAHVRAPLEGKANVTTMSGDLRSVIIDISRGGIALRSEKTPTLGEFVRLRFRVPNGGAVLWVDPDAVVVRASPSGRSTLWALQFVGLTANFGDAIMKYVVSKQVKSPTDQLRTGTRNERNEAIQHLLDKQPRVSAKTAETPRPVTRSFDRIDPNELRRRSTGNPGKFRSVAFAAKHHRRHAPEPAPKAAGAREIADLYRAAVADIASSKDKKKRR